MADQQVCRIERLTAQLRIEVGTARLEAAARQNVVIGRAPFPERCSGTGRYPSRTDSRCGSCVDRAEDAERIGKRQLMLEGMAGEDRMALLDVELHFVFEAVLLQEAIDRRDVVVVLVLGRLLRLRLDQDRALVADLVLVLDDEVEEAAELVELAADIGVEQGFVAFAAAPQNVVFAAELLRGVRCRS